MANRAHRRQTGARRPVRGGDRRAVHRRSELPAQHGPDAAARHACEPRQHAARPARLRVRARDATGAARLRPVQREARMVNPFRALYGWLYPAPPAPAIEPAAIGIGTAPVRYGYHDGEKFPGGFGFTDLLIPDYWTLRARSTQLFKKNLYARGLVRRLV